MDGLFSVANPKQACMTVSYFVVIFFLVVFCFLLYNLAWFKSIVIVEKNRFIFCLETLLVSSQEEKNRLNHRQELLFR